MSSPPEKQMTFYLRNWYVDREVIRTNGYQESPLFGAGSTFFYWRAKEDGCVTYTFQLYLSACKEAKVYVEVDFRLGDTYSDEEETEEDLRVTPDTLKGVLSLDKRKTLQVDIIKSASFLLSTLITFEELGATLQSIRQQKHDRALASQLVSFRESATAADITLVTTVDGRKFSVHKGMLASRSTVFSAMFDHEGFKENQLKRVEVEDVTGEVMDALLKYVYSADVEGIEKIAGELLKAADKYDLPLLVEECAQSLVNSLTVNTAARCFYLADLYRLEDFKKQVVSFISKNRQAVRDSDGWKQYIGFEQIQQLYDLNI